MRLFLCLIVQALVLVASAQKKSSYPEGLYAEVITSKGLIVLQLEFEKTPLAVSSFVGLAEGTVENAAVALGVPFYNGSRWYRVVPGHVIQCGNPGNGSETGVGYSFPNEINLPELNHARAGMVTMANGGPHTNSSHWCITLGDRSYLDGDYTVFGHVIKGLEFASAITQEDVIKTIKIVRVGKAASAFQPSTESFQAIVAKAKIRVSELEATNKLDDERYIQSNWPEAKEFMRLTIVQIGEGPRVQRGTKVSLRYKGQFLRGESFVSTSDAGKPWYGEAPAPFDYVVGTSSINPGFDAGIVGMRKGEKRILIVPSEQAYGGGYYPPERKGEKRFHVSPNQTIVYEVELLEVIK